jgi:hypothetical protein
MPLPEPVAKIGSLLIEHIRSWGWAVVGWFKPEAQRQRRIHRLLSWLGEIRTDLMREPTNPQHGALLRRAEKFGRAAVDFHNSDTATRISPTLPVDAARPPAEAQHNTREGHAALAFWLEWHRQQLLHRRGDVDEPRRRRE